MKCNGNALQCTVHGSRWHTTAITPTAQVCEHAYLAGHEHVHGPDGNRYFVGTVDEPMAGLRRCVCDESAPWSPPGYVGGGLL